ncbi:13597_t:CDS:1 [Entrophospora sp. SA101]|nr:6895_t:CDS:1 [Entrophospora sp. SA101]CAJ0838758.1 13597_t:CDS:1 [Entrophospora sp. SA101]
MEKHQYDHFYNQNQVGQSHFFTNNQNFGGNNQIPESNNFNHQSNQNLHGNNYTNQNFGCNNPIHQNYDNFSTNYGLNSTYNDMFNQKPTIIATTTNVNNPNNPFIVGEHFYQNDYCNCNQNVTIDQNSKKLLFFMASQIQNLQNTINQLLDNISNNDR